MKKYSFVLFILIINLLFYSFVFAGSQPTNRQSQNLKDLLNQLVPSDLPSIISCGDFYNCLNTILAQILRLILLLAVALATIFLVFAGILYITQPNKTKEIHQRVIWSIIGFIVALTSYGLIYLLGRWISNSKISFVLPIVFAQKIPEEQIPSSIQCGVPSVISNPKSSVSTTAWKECIWYYAAEVLKLLYKISLAFAVIFLTIAGILYITQPKKTKETHQRLIYGIIGAIVALLSFTIVKIIENFFLNIQ